MTTAYARHSGLERAQSERGASVSRRDAQYADVPPGLSIGLAEHQGRTDDAGQARSARPLTTGSRLKSGIQLTFPDAHHLSRDLDDNRRPGSGSSSQRRAAGAARGGRRDAARSSSKTPRRSGGSGSRAHGSTGDLTAGEAADKRSPQPRMQSASSGHLSEGSASGEALQLRMEQLKLEKERADELSRQVALQAQALVEERAAMRAERDDLARSRDEMAARLQLLESLIDGGGDGEDDGGDAGSEASFRDEHL